LAASGQMLQNAGKDIFFKEFKQIFKEFNLKNCFFMGRDHV